MEGSMWADRILMDREGIISTYDTIEYIKKNVHVSYQGKVSDGGDDYGDNEETEEEKEEYSDAVENDEDVKPQTENLGSVRVCEIQVYNTDDGYGEEHEGTGVKQDENINSIKACKDGGVGVKEEVREIHKVNKSHTRMYSTMEKMEQHKPTEGKNTKAEASSWRQGHQHSQQNPTTCEAASGQALYCHTCLTGPRCCVDLVSPDTVLDTSPADTVPVSKHHTAATVSISSDTTPDTETDAAASDTSNDTLSSSLTTVSKSLPNITLHSDTFTSYHGTTASSFDFSLDTTTTPDTGSSYSSSHQDSDSDEETVISFYLGTNKSESELSVVEYEYYIDEDDAERYDHDYDSLCGSEEDEEEQEKEHVANDEKQMRGVNAEDKNEAEGKNENGYDHEYLLDEDQQYFTEHGMETEEVLEDEYEGDEYLVDEEDYDEEEEEYLVDDDDYQEGHSRGHEPDNLSYYQEPLEVILEILGEEEEEEETCGARAVRGQSRIHREECEEDLMTFSFSDEFRKNDVNIDENIVIHEDAYNNTNTVPSSSLPADDESFHDYANIESLTLHDAEKITYHTNSLTTNSKGSPPDINRLTAPVTATKCKDYQAKQEQELQSLSSRHTIESRSSHLGLSRPHATGGEGSDSEKLRCLTTEIESYLKETTKLLEKVAIYTKISDPSVPREADLMQSGQVNENINSSLPHEISHRSQTDDLRGHKASETLSTTFHTQESIVPHQTRLNTGNTKTRNGLDVENLCSSIQDQFNNILKDVEAAGRQNGGTTSLPPHHHHHHQPPQHQHDQKSHLDTNKRSGTRETTRVCNDDWRQEDEIYSTVQINTGINENLYFNCNIREELHPKVCTPEKYVGSEHGHDSPRGDVNSRKNIKHGTFSSKESSDMQSFWESTTTTEKVNTHDDCKQNSLLSSDSHEVFRTLMETKTSMESRYFSAAESSTDAVDALEWDERNREKQQHHHHCSRIIYRPPERSKEDELFFTSLDNTQDYSWLSSSEDYANSSLDPEVMSSLNATNSENKYEFSNSKDQVNNTSVDLENLYKQNDLYSTIWTSEDHVSSRPINLTMLQSNQDYTSNVMGNWKATTSGYLVNSLDPELLASLDPLLNNENNSSASGVITSVVVPPERDRMRSHDEASVSKQVNKQDFTAPHDSQPSPTTSPDYENIYDVERETSLRTDSPPPTVPCLDNLEKLYRRLSQEYDIDLSNICTSPTSDSHNKRGTPVGGSNKGKDQRSEEEHSINRVHHNTSEVHPQQTEDEENRLRIHTRENEDTTFNSVGTQRKIRRSKVCAKLDEIFSKAESVSPEYIVSAEMTETDANTSVVKPVTAAETHTDGSFSHPTNHVEVAGIQHQLNEILSGIDVMYNRYMEKNRKESYEQCTSDISNKTKLNSSTSDYREALESAHHHKDKHINTSTTAGTEKSSYQDILNISEDLKHICVFHVNKPGESKTPSSTQGHKQQDGGDSRTDTTSMREVIIPGHSREGNQGKGSKAAGQGHTRTLGINLESSQYAKEDHEHAAVVQQYTMEGYRYATENHADENSGGYQPAGSTSGISKPTTKEQTPGDHSANLTPAGRLMEMIEYESNVATFLATIRKENRECYAAAARYLHNLLASVAIPDKVSGPALPLSKDLTHSQVGEGVGCQE